MDKLYVPVSVIIPCYCCDNTIERAIESINKQTKMPREVILIEDCSPDGGKTKNKLYDIQKKYGNHWIKIIVLEKNLGPGGARNIGWDMATQKYIAFLDADDSWHPYKLEIQVSIMEKENADLCAHISQIKEDIKLDNLEDLNNVKKDLTYKEISKKRLLFSNKIPTRSVMIKNEMSFRFNPNKRFSEDYLLWLSILFDNYKGIFIDYPLAFSYKTIYNKKGLSSNLWEMEKGELHTYSNLYSQKKITKLMQILVSIISITKYLIRYIIYILKNWG